MSVENIVRVTSKLERRLEELRDRVRKLEQVLNTSPSMITTAKDFFSMLKSTRNRRQIVQFLKNIDLILSKIEELDVRLQLLENKVKEIEAKMNKST